MKKGAVDAKAVIVYFSDDDHGICMAIKDADTACTQGEAASSLLESWNTGSAYTIAGKTWFLPTKDDWSKVWKYRMVNKGYDGADFPVNDLLDAVGASLPDNKEDKGYWTNTPYYMNLSSYYVFQVWSFQGRYESGYTDWGFLEEYYDVDKGCHVRYMFSF